MLFKGEVSSFKIGKGLFWIFLTPLIQDETSFKIKNSVFIFSLVAFLSLLTISSIFTIRLILPAEVAYLSTPVKYYKDYRLRYEEQLTDKTAINDLLKGSYISELQQAVETNKRVFRRKSSFYYSALVYALFSIIPYVICLGFHITFHEDFIQKVQIVNTEKISNFMKTDSNAVRNPDDHKKADKKSKKIQTSHLPGIDNSLVIPSWPNLIKENSQHISNEEDSEHIPKDYRK